MPSNHLILCCPLLLSSIFPSIRIFSNELTPRIRVAKVLDFQPHISPSSEYSGLTSFRIDWFDLFDLKSLLQHIHCIWFNNIFFSCCGLVLLFTSALCSEEYPGLYAFFQFCNIKPAWDIRVLSAGVCNALCGDSHTLSVEAHMRHLGGIQVECWATCHSGGGWLPVRYLMGCGGRPLPSVVSFWDLHSGFLTQALLPCSYFPQDHSARLTPSMLRKG